MAQGQEQLQDCFIEYARSTSKLCLNSSYFMFAQSVFWVVVTCVGWRLESRVHFFREVQAGQTLTVGRYLVGPSVRTKEPRNCAVNHMQL